MRSLINHSARLGALALGWIAALALAMLVIAPTVTRPGDEAEPVAVQSLSLPDGTTVPDLGLELPEALESPEEDHPAWDCRVDGNQICGPDAYVLDGYGEPVPVAPGYYGQHCYGEPYNPGARDALGLPALDWCE
ncbi:hypothetical protein [Nocardia sp. IFM 10818]